MRRGEERREGARKSSEEGRGENTMKAERESGAVRGAEQCTMKTEGAFTLEATVRTVYICSHFICDLATRCHKEK